VLKRHREEGGHRANEGRLRSFGGPRLSAGEMTVKVEHHPEGRAIGVDEAVVVASSDPVVRLGGGQVHCTTDDRTTRTPQVEVLSDTGFHLGAGLYFGFEG
jgi:hypothetical protein